VPTGDSTIRVSEGDIIEAGEVIGRTGETGNSGGIHLHFEVRRCDEGGRCQIQNPSSVFLAGQDSPCPWEALSNDN
jgi:murein DD-endopeptidase MepM/ murein hydrolase activator NlpD